MTRSSPYLSGNFAPVREEVTAFDLPVTGTIPRELEGRLLRIGPNPVEPIDPSKYHWFTGNGMVHGVRLRGGRAEWYRNRYVRDDMVVAARGGPKTPGPRHGMGPGVANTNVIGLAGKTWAIVEAGGSPVELSYELDTVAYSNFGGTLPGSFTAHPKRDPDTGELHAMVYYWAWDYVQYVVVGTDGRVRKTVNVPVPGKPMLHDCAITERYVVIFDLPCTFDAQAAAQRAAFPYVWNPDYGARVGLLPREGAASQVRWLEAPLCYVFHPLNAYETADGQVVLDVVRHARIFDRDKLGPNEGAPTLDRWLLDPTSGKLREERLDDRGQEFPRHDERRIGKPIRYGYTAALGEGLGVGPLYKHDLVRRTSQVRDEGKGRSYLEPVFVPRTADADEDDGWILVYAYDAPSDGGLVQILHAQDFTGRPVATIHLPQRVPYGFHGNWVPDEA
jgi:carotenoid cleavage dioxygenase